MLSACDGGDRRFGVGGDLVHGRRVGTSGCEGGWWSSSSRIIAGMSDLDRYVMFDEEEAGGSFRAEPGALAEVDGGGQVLVEVAEGVEEPLTFVLADEAGHHGTQFAMGGVEVGGVASGVEPQRGAAGSVRAALMSVTEVPRGEAEQVGSEVDRQS